MNKESPFSEEYEVGASVTSVQTIHEQSHAPSKEERPDLIQKIESDYKLSKPRRTIIRARIISE